MNGSNSKLVQISISLLKSITYSFWVNYKLTTNSILSLFVFNDLGIVTSNLLQRRRHHWLPWVLGKLTIDLTNTWYQKSYYKRTTNFSLQTLDNSIVFNVERFWWNDWLVDLSGKSQSCRVKLVILCEWFGFHTIKIPSSFFILILHYLNKR